MPNPQCDCGAGPAQADWHHTDCPIAKAAGVMRVAVSGKTYFGAMDPLCTDVPKEHGWPKPGSKKVGRGHQYVYKVTAATATEMAEHLECLADGFSYSDDDYARSEGRAFAKDAARIRDQLIRAELSSRLGA
jgi:hypothetical protein